MFRLVVGGIVAGYAPSIILSSHAGSTPIHLGVWVMTGAILMAVGILVYLQGAWDFAYGAQADAPTILVARGTYRFVRNPIYASLVLILLGEAVLFQSWRLLGYAVAFWACVHLMVILYEERALARKFGASYAEYCRDVPRWIPRARRPTP
jgi:protein-S-isoprenylcysteine O-methyltransferase Ste14